MQNYEERTTYGDPGGIATFELHLDEQDWDMFHIYVPNHKAKWHVATVHRDFIPNLLGFNPETALAIAEGESGPWRIRVHSHILCKTRW